MSSRKATIAEPTQYPPCISGYFAVAFKKSKEEKILIKEAKRNHKALIDAEFGNQFSAQQRKKIMNSTSYRLAD